MSRFLRLFDNVVINTHHIKKACVYNCTKKGNYAQIIYPKTSPSGGFLWFSPQNDIYEFYEKDDPCAYNEINNFIKSIPYKNS